MGGGWLSKVSVQQARQNKVSSQRMKFSLQRMEDRNNQCYRSTQLKLQYSQTGYSMIEIATLILLKCHTGIGHITVYYVI